MLTNVTWYTVYTPPIQQPDWSECYTMVQLYLSVYLMIIIYTIYNKKYFSDRHFSYNIVRVLTWRA